MNEFLGFLLSQFHAVFKKHIYDFFESDQQLKEHVFKKFLFQKMKF